MSSKKLVCHGAICKCQFGDTPDTFTVTSQKKNYINDNKGSQKLIATDKELGAPFQIKTFGQCKMQPILLGFKPCMPNITKWDGAFDKLELQENQGLPLLEDSKATCSFSGTPCVEITFHGQTATPSSQNVDNADEEAIGQVLPLLNIQEIKREKADIFIEEVTSSEKEEEYVFCEATSVVPSAPSGMIGTCDYYKWRFNNFMERHETCKHNPPDYYYGDMRKVYGGFGLIDGINEWWTPSLEEEMGSEKIPVYKRKHGNFKPVPSSSYGYKYCVSFTKVLMPKLSLQGKLWLTLAKEKLQIYMEQGLVNKNYISKKNIDFNTKNNLPIAAETFYTDIEKRNTIFRDFAFATHPDAYLDAGMLNIPISDKIKILVTPDFKEWGKGATWDQAIIVLEKQIQKWYEDAENGVKEAQKTIERTVQEVEEYLELFRDAKEIWDQVNASLQKYRRMPWL